MGAVFQPLFDQASAIAELPVIAYGRDMPNSFSFTLASGGEDVALLHAEALRNLATQEATVESIEVDGATLVTVSDSFYAAEKLLDVAFMRGLHVRLGELVAAAIPRRGLLLATAASEIRGLATLRAIAAQEAAGSRRISDAILLVRDGEILGVSHAAEAPAPANKKPGWLRRLFGRN